MGSWGRACRVWQLLGVWKKGVNPILDFYSKEKIDEAVGAVGLDSSDEDIKAFEDRTRRELWN